MWRYADQLPRVLANQLHATPDIKRRVSTKSLGRYLLSYSGRPCFVLTCRLADTDNGPSIKTHRVLNNCLTIQQPTSDDRVSGREGESKGGEGTHVVHRGNRTPGQEHTVELCLGLKTHLYKYIKKAPVHLTQRLGHKHPTTRPIQT